VNLSFLLPSALAALAALLLPVLIHLSRRSERTLTDFAALRWLDAKLRPRRKLVFQELPLLAVRLLLLALLAVFLAQPVLLAPVKPAHWLVVVPGADIGAAENLPEGEHVQRHWLAPGFPAIDRQPTAVRTGTGSLLRELDAMLPAATKLTVLVPERMSGLDGERPQLSRVVDWRVLPGKMPDVLEPTAPPVIRLAVRYQSGHASDLRYLRAVHSAWQSGMPVSERKALDAADTNSPLPDKTAYLIWQADGALPKDVQQWVQAGGRAVVTKETILPAVAWLDSTWQATDGNPLLKTAGLGQGRVWQWQRAFNPQSLPELLDPAFPERLQSLLAGNVAPPDKSLASLQNPRAGLPAWPELPESLAPWLALLIGLLLVLERWMAGAKHRWGGA
jgi:hypothetical protein